jgi:hypothetical protein
MKALPTKDWREFGKIIVSGDYQGDLNAIVNVLNSLQWTYYPRGEQYEWGIEQPVVYDPPSAHMREIIVLNGEVLYPSLRPIGDIFVLKDGRRCFADDADESFIAQWEADKDKGALDWSEYTLSKLSALISPHLNKGTMEFVAVHARSGPLERIRLLEDRKTGAGDVIEVYGSHGYVSHERLLVRSDGCVEWHACRKLDWTGDGGETLSEYYEPSTLTAFTAKGILDRAGSAVINFFFPQGHQRGANVARAVPRESQISVCGKTFWKPACEADREGRAGNFAKHPICPAVLKGVPRAVKV